MTGFQSLAEQQMATEVQGLDTRKENRVPTIGPLSLPANINNNRDDTKSDIILL